MKKLKLMMFAIVASILFVPALNVYAEEKTVDNFSAFKTNVASATATDVIKLNNDIKNAEALTIEKSVTIDLNGHTYEGSAFELLTIKGANVKVTIEDSSTNGKIQTTNTATNSKIIRMMDHANLTIESGTIANNAAGMVGISVEGESSLVLKGTAKVVMTPKLNKLRTYGINIVDGTADIQSGASVESSDSIGEAVSVKDTLTLSGGTIKSTNKGVAISSTMGKDVTITITSGTVESDSDYGVKLADFNNFTMTGGTVKTGISQRNSNIKIGTNATVNGKMKIDDSSKTDIKGNVTGDKFYSAGVVVKTGKETGTAKLSKTSAKKGEKITLTTTPSEGYRIASIKVVKTGDESTVVTFNEEDNSFTMPDYTVLVYVSYETYDINVSTPTGDVTVSEDATEVLKDAVNAVEDEEIQTLLKHNDSTVTLETNKIEEPEKEVVEKFEAVIKGATVTDYFDAEIVLRVAGKEAKIHELGKAITLTVELPELPAVKEGYKRTFYILREHNGKVTKLDATLTEDGNSLTFATDKFSTYALAYLDERVETPVTNTAEENPKTGDNILMYLGLGLASVAVTTLSVKKLRKSN